MKRILQLFVEHRLGEEFIIIRVEWICKWLRSCRECRLSLAGMNSAAICDPIAQLLVKVSIHKMPMNNLMARTAASGKPSCVLQLFPELGSLSRKWSGAILECNSHCVAPGMESFANKLLQIDVTVIGIERSFICWNACCCLFSCQQR